ncbi:MAG TPA: T9SS type A sorting domain-containing protein [Bacteroidia bacterium]|nr:T9SS type A sorting domain-containing protein [Bacteroidia bacterium]
MKKNTTLLLGAALFITFTVRAQSTIKILFDGGHATTCSNADWIPDADLHDLDFSGGPASCCTGNKSDAQRFPTPAQSGVTASTAETYWEGGLSAWGIDCAKHNYQVESLPWNVPFTYGTSAAQDLSNYNAVVICEPNIKFTTTEKTALMNFIANGGGLFMISDHTGSDRNGDGWDSPMIWNDFLTNNGVDNNNPFGIAYDLANFSETTTNIANLPGDSCLHGPMGNVTQAKWSNGTSMTLSPTANPNVKGVVYMTASTAGGTTGVMFAHSTYGKGKIAAMGDSSPPDDGTGNPSCTLYNGYFTDAAGNHQLLIMNATIWLVTKGTTVTGINDGPAPLADLSFFPNPCQETANIRFRLPEADHLHITVSDLMGRELMVVADENRASGENGISFSTTSLPAGIYTYRITGNSCSSAGKFIVSSH